MTELNSCFTRNQFRRSTAARLFTLCTVGNDDARNFAHQIPSGFHLLLFHTHYFHVKFTAPRIRQQHWGGREVNYLPKNALQKGTDNAETKCGFQFRAILFKFLSKCLYIISPWTKIQIQHSDVLTSTCHSVAYVPVQSNRSEEGSSLKPYDVTTAAKYLLTFRRNLLPPFQGTCVSVPCRQLWYVCLSTLQTAMVRVSHYPADSYGTCVWVPCRQLWYVCLSTLQTAMVRVSQYPADRYGTCVWVPCRQLWYVCLSTLQTAMVRVSVPCRQIWYVCLSTLQTDMVRVSQYPADRYGKIFRNVCNYLPTDSASYFRRPDTVSTPLW
jgi:hypothetical protein